jgi:hypothetical protein
MAVPPPTLRVASRALCLALLAALLYALVPAAAGAAADERYRDRVGFGTHMRYDRQADVVAELERLRAGGVTWIREDFRWDQLEPVRGANDWRLSDNLMTAAATAGVDVLALIDYSAPWASSDPSGNGDILYPPRDPDDYAAFARQVVERYGAGGAFWALHPELTPRPLRAIEVWNEPYGRWFWKPNPDPPAYAQLVRRTSAAVRQVDPQIDVLAAGDLLQARTDGAIVGWLESLLDADPGLGDAIDAWSVHPYPGPRDLGPYDAPKPRFAFSRLTMSRDIAAARGASKPFWITEVGWSTGPGDPEGVSEERQAEYTTGAVRRAIGEWGVERIFLYSWGKSKAPREQRDYTFRRADNSARPAWDALRALIGGAEPTVSLRAVTAQAGRGVTVRASGVAADGGPVTLRWDLDGDGDYDDAGGAEAALVPAAAGPLRIGVEATDASGAKARASVTLQVLPATGEPARPGTGPNAAPTGTAGPGSEDPTAPVPERGQAITAPIAPVTFGVAAVTQSGTTVARRGLALRLRCPEGCDALIEVLVPPATARRLGVGRAALSARKPVVVGKGSKRLRKAPATVRVPLTNWVRKRLRSRARVDLIVRALLTDRATGERRTVVLRTRVAPAP